MQTIEVSRVVAKQLAEQLEVNEGTEHAEQTLTT